MVVWTVKLFIMSLGAPIPLVLYCTNPMPRRIKKWWNLLQHVQLIHSKNMQAGSAYRWRTRISHFLYQNRVSWTQCMGCVMYQSCASGGIEKSQFSGFGQMSKKSILIPSFLSKVSDTSLNRQIYFNAAWNSSTFASSLLYILNIRVGGGEVCSWWVTEMWSRDFCVSQESEKPHGRSGSEERWRACVHVLRINVIMKLEGLPFEEMIEKISSTLAGFFLLRD